MKNEISQAASSLEKEMEQDKRKRNIERNNTTGNHQGGEQSKSLNIPTGFIAGSNAGTIFQEKVTQNLEK
ncbi:hypothetical protein ACIQW7_24505 [Peribacillus simplex]|uniref:hypothetical protein n=1 Tax=Peribacillus simplex TaxID=1478 RepID=UPI0038078BAC